MRVAPASTLLLAAAAILALAPPAHALANHVVISELASRGTTTASDEFVELYNPTTNPIDIGGWKLQYKSSTGATWGDRAILPGGTFIAAHGFYLIANQSYVGSPTPDYTSGLWNSGSSMADNGHMRILNASSTEIDKVGLSGGDSPEGTAAPNHGTSANNNSIERQASETATAASMNVGGADELQGNGVDTDNNFNDFVVQNNGRHPQNSGNAPEPSLIVSGSGTGRARINPTQVFTSRSLASLELAFAQDSAYTLSTIKIYVPPAWTWSHNVADVALSGAGLASASKSLVGDSIIVTSAAITTTDSGSVTVANLTTPATKGTSTFSVLTAVGAVASAPIARQPAIRVLDLVPIVSIHVNDSQGVPVAPFAVGTEVTVSGIVTANLSTVRTDVYMQDVTGGINVFNAAVSPIALDPGDSVTITGGILQFRGTTEVNVDFNLITKHATGRPIPAPELFTCAGVNGTFHPDFTEPDEGRLIRINGVSYNSINATITDASGTTNIFIPNTWPAPPSQFDVIGILKQFKPGTPAPGPPYTTDYEIVPRTPDDIIAHAGPVILGTPFEDQIQSTSVRINWSTNVASSSIVRYGLTTALGDSVMVATPVTTHAITVPGLTPATVYYYSVGSGDVNGTNFSSNAIFSTASPPQSTGQIGVYFNKSVNTSVAWLHPANGNQDLTARLKTRLDNAKRSIDAAFYNLSGTSGAALANALIAAKNRGVKVRVICEYDNRTNAPFTSISGAGIPLINDRFDAINNGTGLMHNKFVVVDSRGGAPESTWTWTGSWNPTDPGTDDDLQNSIEIQDQALARIYTLEFNEMWGSSTDTPNASVSRFGQRKLDDTPHKFSIGGRDVECYFSPSDGTNSKIISLLNGAQHSIAFELLTLTRDDIAAALISQKNAGREVRGDLDNGSDSGSEYTALVGAGVDVRLKTGVSGLLHHKYCLVDAENPHWNSATLTGSHNWSSAAENTNNENTVLVRDFDVTNQYLQEFIARYYQFGGTDSVTVSVELIGAGAGVVSLAQNSPNPFTSRTGIEYAIPSAQKVELRLYDVQGREVQTLVNVHQAAGRYRVELTSKGLSAGVYFYRLQAGKVAHQRKMLVVR